MSEALAQPAVDPAIEQPAHESAGLMDGIYNLMQKHPMAAKIGVVVGMGGGFVAAEGLIPSMASASGESGNSLVCGGVHSKAQALRLAEGAPDACGNRDIGKAWAELGITPQIIKTMHVGTVSSRDGLISEGRQHSPVPSADKPVRLGPGDKIFLRPLSVWGDTTYAALVGHTEDGHEVAILEGCGNGQGHPVPNKPHKKPRKHHQRTAQVEVVKIAENDQGHILPATPTGEFVFEEKCRLGSKVVDRTVVYNHTPQNLGRCNVGSKVTITELTPRGPETWKMLTPAVQKMKVLAGKLRNKFVFKDQEVPPTTPPTPPTVPPKNGTEGPGAGTPGQPGGPGAGGQPGNTGEGAPCYDDNSTVNGDLNPATSDTIMYGTPDQFGNCVGPAQPMA